MNEHTQCMWEAESLREQLRAAEKRAADSAENEGRLRLLLAEAEGKCDDANQRLADAERERDEARLDRDRINSQMLVEREEAAASAVTLGSALSASQDLVRRLGGMFSQIIRESAP